MKRSVLKILLLVAGVVGFTCTAAADSFTFNISGTIPSSGRSVTSTVTITSTGVASNDPNRGFDIKILNTTSDPRDITQVLDGINFNLISGVSLNNLAMKSGTYKDLNNHTKSYSTSAIIRTLSDKNPGTYTDSGPATIFGTQTGQIDWGLVNGETFKICAGALSHSGSCSLQPDGIIGASSTSGNYDANVASIFTHTPQLYGGEVGKEVVFHVYASNVTANTSIASVIKSADFYYGTGGGNDKITTCVGNCGGGGGGNVPEPSSFLLVGTGLSAVVARLRRRK